MKKIKCKNYKTGKDEYRTIDYIWDKLDYLLPYAMIEHYKKTHPYMLKVMEEKND